MGESRLSVVSIEFECSTFGLFISSICLKLVIGKAPYQAINISMAVRRSNGLVDGYGQRSMLLFWNYGSPLRHLLVLP